MTTVQTIEPQIVAALSALDSVAKKFNTLLRIARKMDAGQLSSAFAVSQIQSAFGAMYDITARPQLFTPERAASRLMAVAGTLSDIQEYYFVEYELDEDGQECDMGGSLLPTEVNDLLNAIKSDIFDAIDMVNPRR